MTLHDPFRNRTGLQPPWKFTVVPGGSAGPLTLTGIDPTRDHLVAVLALAGVVWSELAPFATGHAAGVHVVTAAEETAETVSIDTGLTAPDTFTVMILRAGVPVFSDQALSLSGADIVVADGSTYALTEDDEIHWTAFDASDASLEPELDGTADGADLTDEFSISDTDEIDNTGGTDTTGDVLLVIWYDHDLGARVNAPGNV